MILCPLTIIIIISGRFSFVASLAVVICTNTGVVGESTEITITFNTLCFVIIVVDASTQSLSRILMLLLFVKFCIMNLFR